MVRSPGNFFEFSESEWSMRHLQTKSPCKIEVVKMQIWGHALRP